MFTVTSGLLFARNVGQVLKLKVIYQIMVRFTATLDLFNVKSAAKCSSQKVKLKST
jgi:hypothetical protein